MRTTTYARVRPTAALVALLVVAVRAEKQPQPPKARSIGSLGRL